MKVPKNKIELYSFLSVYQKLVKLFFKKNQYVIKIE